MGEYGPITYQGLTWVGVISEAYLEIWRRDATTKSPMLDGARIDLFDTPSNLSRITFQLEDFVDVKSHMSATVSFQWDRFQHMLGGVLKDFAAHRCREMITAMRTRLGDF
ncbi:hypothetical protein VTN77DRAFT_3088 [Rasamsonia byssochlamydoides]|uniref:uncharacterized protein n=1 Tax=Rasamsonia byssochlamydoides TaxID=89139 RepID=UPI00374352B6